MIKQVVSRLGMALVLLFGLHFSAPVSARVQGDEEPPVKLINASLTLGCGYKICFYPIFHGTIATTGNQPVYGTEVEVTLFKDGDFFDSQIVSPIFPAVLPGRYYGVDYLFGTLVWDPNNNPFTFTARIVTYSLQSAINYALVDVSFIPPHPDNQDYRDWGYIYNDWSFALKDIAVFADEGNCLYPSSTVIKGPIFPNQSVLFPIHCYSADAIPGVPYLIGAQGVIFTGTQSTGCMKEYCAYLPIAEGKMGENLPVRVAYIWPANLIDPPDDSHYNFVAYLEAKGSLTSYNVSILASAYDISDTLIASQVFTSNFTGTLPGQFNPVLGQFNIPTNQVARVEANIQNFDLTAPTSLVNVFPITGYIYNNYPFTLTNITLDYYASSSNPFDRGYLRWNFPEQIAPGQAITYTFPNACLGVHDICTTVFVAGQGQLER